MRTLFFNGYKMNPRQQELTPAESAICDLIDSNNAIVAIVFDLAETTSYEEAPTIDYSYIDENFLDQIFDSNTKRPSRAVKFFTERLLPVPESVNKMNMRSEEVKEHVLGEGQKGKIFHHTKKTSTTLMPSDPCYMELFQCDYGIGFLWKKRWCNLKEEKYIFEFNACTDEGYWFDLDTPEKIEALKEFLKIQPLSSVAQLIDKNINAVKNKTRISWNELVVGLPEKSLSAVFATQDNRSSRLRALRGMLHAKDKLQFTENLPVFIIQPYYALDSGEMKIPDRPAVYRVYSKVEQEADLFSEKLDLDAQQASLELIKNHRALAMVIPDQKALDNCLTQISNPTANRPSRSADFFASKGKPRPDVITKMNLKTQDIDNNFHPGTARDKKPTGYQYPSTVKMPTFLLPREPQWLKAQPEEIQMGIFCDVNACDLKNGKYLLAGDATNEKTETCFWLDLDSPEKIDALKKRLQQDPIVTLETIRQHNDEAQQAQTHTAKNTILAGLPKGRVDGVFCYLSPTDDSSENRLKAYDMMLQIKTKLKLERDLPIFIISNTNKSFRIYNDIERVMDQTQDAWDKLNPQVKKSRRLPTRSTPKPKAEENENVEEGYVMVARPRMG